MSDYKFVVLGVENELFRISFNDAIERGVQYVTDFFYSGNQFLQILRRFHFSTKINRIVQLPLKKIWLKKSVIKNESNTKLCFVLFTNWIRVERELHLVDFLRRNYRDCKIVWFIQDIIKTIKDPYTGINIDLEYYKNKLDGIVSYDMLDVANFGLMYHPTVLSKISLIEKESVPQYDIFFLGKSKGRLTLLKELCEKFKKNKMKCGFYVAGVPLENRKPVEGIVYIDKPISYRENLLIASKSKFLLELMQSDAVGYTFRTSEAILYKKKLITDNLAIKQAPFYNSDDVFLVQELDSKIGTIKEMIEKNCSASYQAEEVISPKHFFDFLNNEMLR